MSWRGQLSLNYSRDAERTIAHDRHEGPLRVLQRLYPEGPGVCHHVLVHPPGGIVGGDTLEIDATLDEGCHAVLTTPGAARFYRSSGEPALQQVRAKVADRARLEWLPLETIAYSGCVAENLQRFDLAPTAEMIGWDVLALGLPAAGEPFERGRVRQQLQIPGAWLERGCIDAQDQLLLESPLGFGGQRVLATAWFAAGTAIADERRDALLTQAREAIDASPLAASAGASALQARVVVLRVLAQRVEPAMQLLMDTWARWRQAAWQLVPCPPRVWRT